MRICPGCGGEFDRLLAVSRVDNKTMLCDACGMKEAIEVMDGRNAKNVKARKLVNLK